MNFGTKVVANGNSATLVGACGTLRRVKFDKNGLIDWVPHFHVAKATTAFNVMIPYKPSLCHTGLKQYAQLLVRQGQEQTGVALLGYAEAWQDEVYRLLYGATVGVKGKKASSGKR